MPNRGHIQSDYLVQLSRSLLSQLFVVGLLAHNGCLSDLEMASVILQEGRIDHCLHLLSLSESLVQAKLEAQDQILVLGQTQVASSAAFLDWSSIRSHLDRQEKRRDL